MHVVRGQIGSLSRHTAAPVLQVDMVWCWFLDQTILWTDYTVYRTELLSFLLYSPDNSNNKASVEVLSILDCLTNITSQ